MGTTETVKGKPILILTWEQNKDFTGYNTFTWHDHTVQVDIHSIISHGNLKHDLYIDFHYNGKSYRYLPLITKRWANKGEFPHINDDDDQWLDFKFTATSLGIYERTMKTMGDFMDRIGTSFDSYGFRQVEKKNSPNDGKLHLTVRMISKSSSEIAPKP